ncbi:hypothetical protein [Streptomyces sp. NPDC017435]|uniref:hypothetical protein n=1 Tax=Streptomyces sp. NPDC017435 TaxID=3364995 RepID=UPI00379F5F11
MPNTITNTNTTVINEPRTTTGHKPHHHFPQCPASVEIVIREDTTSQLKQPSPHQLRTPESHYNLDYELLGVACERAKTDSEWDHGALVGQARVSISNTMTVASATRSLSDDGYKNGSSNAVMKAGSEAAKHIWPDGQTDITVKINWIEKIYVP